MSDLPPSRSTPAPRKNRLVCQDVNLQRQRACDGSTKVQATVLCARDQCTKTVEQCATCPRFVRIDVHEAGYTMLCRAHDPEEQPDTKDEPDPMQ